MTSALTMRNLDNTSIVPGLYENLPFEEYQSWPYPSQSVLSVGQRSMLHLRHAFDQPRPPTKAMKFGTFSHSALLEPLKAMGSYVIMPAFEDDIRKPDGSRYEKPKSTKSYRLAVSKFEAANITKTIVTQDEYDNISGMLCAISEHQLAKDCIAGAAESEVSLVWDDRLTGVRCKARLDRVDRANRRIIDLKTTDDIARFAKTILRYGYDVQGAFYKDGWFELTGEHYDYCIVAVEPEAPWGVQAAPVGVQTLMRGREIYRRVLVEYAQCSRLDQWPGYAAIDEWNVPEWALADTEEPITAGGMEVKW